MKILHITQSGGGGVESYLHSLALNVNRDKFQFVFIFPTHSTTIKSFCDNHGIKLYTLKMERAGGLISNVKNILEIYSIIKKENPDIVHLHSAKAGFIGRIASKFAKKRSIFTPHGLSYLSFSGIKRIIFFSLEVFAKKITDKVISCSYSEANRMIYEIGLKPEQIFPIPNAIPVCLEKEISKKAPSPGTKHVGTIARITIQKNPLLLAEVAAKVLANRNDVHFHILGAGLDDNLKEDLLLKIKNLNIEENVTIYQWGSFNNSSEFLQKLDVFVLTSIFEGLPLSLLEAMSEGIPCVVSKCDGNTDVISNFENGFSCITSIEFAEKINLLLDDDILWSKISKQSVSYVKNRHDIKNYVESVEKIYESMKEIF